MTLLWIVIMWEYAKFHLIKRKGLPNVCVIIGFYYPYGWPALPWVREQWNSVRTA